MLVTDPSIPDLAARAAAGIDGGANMVRIRPAGPWRDEHTELLRSLRRRGTPAVIICPADAPEEALAVADGVHLAEDALYPGEMPPGALVGRSTHGERVGDAERLDYAVFGTVFASATHPGGRAAGIDALKRACQALSPLPVLAIGGVTAVNAAECVRAGAAGAAAIRSVLLADDPAKAAADIIQAMREAI
jgi:thiamine-phosphate diphosphorylase